MDAYKLVRFKRYGDLSTILARCRSGAVPNFAMSTWLRGNAPNLFPERAAMQAIAFHYADVIKQNLLDKRVCVIVGRRVFVQAREAILKDSAFQLLLDFEGLLLASVGQAAPYNSLRLLAAEERSQNMAGANLDDKTRRRIYLQLFPPRKPKKGEPGQKGERI
jgi:hypothetical protein